MLRRPDGFMLYDKMGVDFFSTSKLLYANMKKRQRLIRARPNFYMISDNHNVSLAIVDSSLYTRCIALKDDYYKRRLDMLAYTPVELNYLETLAKIFIIPVRQNQFTQENISNNAPVRRIAIAMNTNSACTEFLLEIHSGINNWSLDNIEYPEKISQSYTLMLLIIVAFTLQQ